MAFLNFYYFLFKIPSALSSSSEAVTDCVAKDLAAVYDKNFMYYIYILTNKNNKTLYIGITDNLKRRLYEHKNKLVDGFTKKYNISKLVYFETCRDAKRAIEREKEIKVLLRIKKNLLIQASNPNWDDLGLKLFSEFYVKINSTDPKG